MFSMPDLITTILPGNLSYHMRKWRHYSLCLPSSTLSTELARTQLASTSCSTL